MNKTSKLPLKSIIATAIITAILTAIITFTITTSVIISSAKPTYIPETETIEITLFEHIFEYK